MPKFRGYIVRQDNNENVGVKDVEVPEGGDARAAVEKDLAEGLGIDQIVQLAPDRSAEELMAQIEELKRQLAERNPA